MVAGIGAFAFASQKAAAQEETVRSKIAAAIVMPDEEGRIAVVLDLKKTPSPEIVGWLDKWKEGLIFIYEAEDGSIVPVLMGEPIEGTRKIAIRKLSDDTPVVDGTGNQVGVTKFELDLADTSSSLRKAMREVSDLAALADPDVEKRIKAIENSSVGQRQDKLPGLLELQKIETNSKANKALEQAIAIINLRSDDKAKRLAAAEFLGNRGSLPAFDLLKTIALESKKSGDKEMEKAALLAVSRIELHISRINAAGTLFRGVSSGSVLLVVAIGLAITFGLIGDHQHGARRVHRGGGIHHLRSAKRVRQRPAPLAIRAVFRNPRARPHGDGDEPLLRGCPAPQLPGGGLGRPFAGALRDPVSLP